MPERMSEAIVAWVENEVVVLEDGELLWRGLGWPGLVVMCRLW